MPGARLSNSRGKEAGTAGVFNEAQRLGVAGATYRGLERWPGVGSHASMCSEDPGLEPGGDGEPGDLPGSASLRAEKACGQTSVSNRSLSALWDGCSLLGSPSAKIPYPWWLCFEPSGHLL